MKTAIILHGCPSDKERAMDPQSRTYDRHWIPWTKARLDEAGIPTQVPHMPDPWEPSYERFKNAFEMLPIDEEVVLIGHSCGCAFLVRWLGESKRSIRKLILVAPWKIPDTDDQAKIAFYTYPVDSTIADRVKEIVIFTSDNEEEDGKKSARLFHESLGGKTILLPSHGHYTFDDMETEEFPELVQEVVNA